MTGNRRFSTLLWTVAMLVLTIALICGSEEITLWKQALFRPDKSIAEESPPADPVKPRQMYDGPEPPAEMTEPAPEESVTETQMIPDTPTGAMVPVDGKWYEYSRMVYHAAGGIDSLSYTNSREALEQLLQKDIHTVEIDFLFTTDGELICAHDWPDVHTAGTPMTLESFLNTPVFGRYTPMTAAMVLEYMKQYPGLFLMIDTKEADQTAVVQKLLTLCDYDPEICSRFVIQLYDQKIKAKIQKLYPFEEEQYLFSCYKFGSKHWEKILKICQKENIGIVTVSYGKWNPEIMNAFYQAGILIYQHTINRPDWAREAFAGGSWGIYTDFLAYDEVAPAME